MLSHCRHYSFLDRIIIALEYALHPEVPTAKRPNPMDKLEADCHSEEERSHVAGLMRVNHAGELAAQGLYQGQAATARSLALQVFFDEAAQEENDHLGWCYERLRSLSSYPSYFSGGWYLGAFAIGAGMGAFGAARSLGFMAETEHQVVNHLDQHLAQLPAHDHKTRAILSTMQTDELNHANQALATGAVPLTKSICWLMDKTALIMKKIAYIL